MNRLTRRPCRLALLALLAACGEGGGASPIEPEEPGPEAGSLRVGILGFGAADRWQALRDAVGVQQPGLSLRYCDLDLTDQYDAVRRGEVDVAVVQFVGELDGVDFEPVLSSPRVAVVPAWSELAGASFLTSGDLAELPWLEVGGREPLLASWVGSARDTGAPCVRHPAAIPTAVATTGRVSLHAAAAARYYPRPDVRFVPAEGSPVEIAVATRSASPAPAAVSTSARQSRSTRAIRWRASASSSTTSTLSDDRSQLR